MPPTAQRAEIFAVGGITELAVADYWGQIYLIGDDPRPGRVNDEEQGRAGCHGRRHSHAAYRHPGRNRAGHLLSRLR